MLPKIFAWEAYRMSCNSCRPFFWGGIGIGGCCCGNSMAVNECCRRTDCQSDNCG